MRVPIKIEPKAQKFMEERGIEDVTFNLFVCKPTGCRIGIVKEIEVTYSAPSNASNYRYFKAGKYHLYVSRELKVLGPLRLTVEGVWKTRRLGLVGASIPI